MMVFWNAGLVVLAVPKTGSQSLEAALAERADVLIRHPPGLKHASAQRFQNRLRPFLDPQGTAGLETVAVIRDPLDWLGSWYRYRRRAQLQGHPNSTDAINFDAFVTAYLAPEPPPFAAVGSQHRFVSNRQGKILVDHLFAYEDPAPFHAFLQERLQRVVQPPRLNVSPSEVLVLSPETERRLRVERAGDFDLHRDVRAGTFLQD